MTIKIWKKGKFNLLNASKICIEFELMYIETFLIIKLDFSASGRHF